ncbi:hypothetical protein FFI89_018540 [Bradyrhizobium sp. KBS0727]|uniref:hypothetical protein n=1 Tax=unclassified Bradyrhizobium TaxID=2631580 RepID=UPI00110F00CC|nr:MULTISPECIES: hypothetical protein [unclassified Bradyrhizobium]QDW38968.1 hypothetical protein FFI71_018540 [Bradyrhizobium sp. KBS0725]QDW45571.1 hypothetical protein FFI89_018540 [Bradyrhizobium sp. KBS0727]
MANSDWLTFAEAVEIVRVRLGASPGRSEAVTNAARASGEVRFQNPADPILLMADDGVVGMDMRPGAQNKGGVTADGKPIIHSTASTNPFQISREDLLDWLDRNFPQAKSAAAPNGRKRGARPKADWDVFELALRQRIEQRGFPDEDNDCSDWRFKADVERWGAEFLEARKEPIKEARLREKVTLLLDHIKAGN